jgi:hypothetical protein
VVRARQGPPHTAVRRYGILTRVLARVTSSYGVRLLHQVYSDIPGCAPLLTSAYSAIETLGATAAGRAQLQGLLHLCEAPASAADVQPLLDWWTDAVESIPQENYP